MVFVVEKRTTTYLQTKRLVVAMSAAGVYGGVVHTARPLNFFHEIV